MPLTYTSGNPLQTTAQTLAFGHNARGRTELDPLATALMQQHPAAFAAYTRQCRQNRLKPGMIWVWRESKPWLMFMVVRDTGVGATRLRYVQSAVVNLAHDYRLQGIQSLAIAPLGSALESREMQVIFDYWLRNLALPITIYQ